MTSERTANLPGNGNGPGRQYSAPSLGVSKGLPAKPGGRHGTGCCHTAGSLCVHWSSAPARVRGWADSPSPVGDLLRALALAAGPQVFGGKGVGDGSRRTHTTATHTPWPASKRPRDRSRLSALLRTKCRVKPSLTSNDSRNGVAHASDPLPRLPGRRSFPVVAWRLRLLRKGVQSMASGFVFLICLSPAHR